ncbi:ferredoxin [Lelliottia aquatilis]|uniref:Ferredoxin n=1 Tax=Lelliottia aquatilis TaxID=2080838 RepID=A0ABX4ZWT2_9ENTR|nr:ferredoxin [Lelliottia aquatilis]POZ14828.1 ferredoxin [Lelliottia sp. 7254-16]POZ17874.1 ferredoxin [Lelliottia aquatilis]POZ20246.1 ferredoxin [Lelliottia aquatilis]POZ30446.1 ferredoxin [Lelliottia aquatilis]
MKLANGLTYFFVTDTITQTNVHKHSRSIYDQSVSENNYDYNSTYVKRRDGCRQ